jgi:para-aminobenzoate synthetase component 2
MILVIDNYDSFVYNIARYFECAGEETVVVRNDAITAADVGKMNPSAIVISPGPCTPQEAGVSVELIQKFGPYIPVFGICLGHQCIGEAYGAKTVRAARPMHGMASEIRHTGEDVFSGLPETISVGRYHSLITELQPGSPLEVTARGPENEIMAMRHKTHPVYGVQFHPESILTTQGADMVENFTAIARHWQKRRMAA